MLTGQMRVNTRYDDVAEQDADRAIARDRQVEAGAGAWITHRKNANAIWKPAYAMRGEPNATHAASHPPANTSAIRCPTDDSDGTKTKSAAVPSSAPTMQPRSVSFSTVSAVEPSDTM